MDHLTLDDVINFVSLTEINDESMKLISKVNDHIAQCSECREMVRSFQTVYDELNRTELTEDAGVAIAAAPEQAACSAVNPDDVH